jgi:hypothetical protein
MKKTLLSVVLAVALAAVAGIASTGVSAQEDPDTWSIAVHLRYADGTSYDIVLRTGIPMSDVVEMLQDCARAHWTGSVVRYYCYPIAE